MRKFRGSYTIEAAYIFPIILMCICMAVVVGISMQEEVRAQVEIQMKQEPFDMVEGMYHREMVKELFGEWYEN